MTDDDRNHGHFVSNRPATPMNNGLPVSNSKYLGCRYPIRYPVLGRPGTLRTRRPLCHQGSGMARPGLEPGDTTIFSQALEAVEMAEIPGSHAVPAGHRDRAMFAVCG